MDGLHPDASAATPHRVGRLRFELDGGDETVLLRLRGAIVGGAESWIPEALDAALGALDRPDRTIRIERLEVDLGRLPAEGLTRELLSTAVREALARSLRLSPPEHPAAWLAGAAEDLAEATRFFLERGRLPWWSPVETLAELEAEIAGLRGDLLEELVRAVAPVLRTARAARRLVMELEPEAAIRIAAALPSATAGEFDLAGWRSAAGRDGVEALAGRVRRAAGAAPPPGGQKDPGPTPQSLRRVADVDEAPGDGPPPVGEAEAAPAENEELAAPLEVLAVRDAGLVLAHPYLATLFEARGLAAGGRFAGEAEQQRAIRLTAFLASGDGAAREPELLMAKLLCGWPLDEPVSREAEPSAEDLAEAEALLEAVIGHWTALGSASKAALRETFLTRPGRLSERRDGWRLEVERRGADVLLDRLPWGLSWVHLPWMARPLSVDWI